MRAPSSKIGQVQNRGGKCIQQNELRKEETTEKIKTSEPNYRKFEAERNVLKNSMRTRRDTAQRWDSQPGHFNKLMSWEKREQKGKNQVKGTLLDYKRFKNDQAIPLVGIYPKELKRYSNICTQYCCVLNVCVPSPNIHTLKHQLPIWWLFGGGVFGR